MGGKNHQPCDQYLPESILMSKITSEGLAAIETGNSFLEDALLAEVNGNGTEQNYYLDKAIMKLVEAENTITEFIKCVDNLLIKMDYLAFQDEDYFHTVDFQSFQNSMIQLKIILPNSRAWEVAQNTIQEKGFRGMFQIFKSTMAGIKNNIVKLRETFSLCSESGRLGNLVKSIEENKIPLRQDFSRVYLAWLEFSAIFTCSSLISTELHLRRQGFKSMMDVDVSEMDINVSKSVLCEVGK